MQITGLLILAEGNVFYTAPLCDVRPSAHNGAPAKLAYSVNDAWEVVVTRHQTGRTLRDLFELEADVELFRDYKSPQDEVIGDDTAANFVDGPVFITRRRESFCINIEGIDYPWPKATITVPEIRKLGNIPLDQQIIAEDADGHERTCERTKLLSLNTAAV